MMSGSVRVKGSASQAAGATAHGGLLVIEGDAGARCGISMKGIDIVVGGSIGHMSCFMGQAGRLVVCGDAGDALGDSLYETHIYVKGKVSRWARTASKKRCAPNTCKSCKNCSTRRFRPQGGGFQALRLGPPAVQLQSR
jgi:glutamate synthase domain-containing protein 3